MKILYYNIFLIGDLSQDEDIEMQTVQEHKLKQKVVKF